MKTRLLYLLLFVCSLTFAQNRIYVDADATGANNGGSWANAYTDLQSALAIAYPTTEIWIAEGVYIPHVVNPQASFNVSAGVSLYGGFNGTETTLSQRNPALYVTRLTGDKNLDDVDVYSQNAGNVLQRLDNIPHVITLSGTDVIIDGLTIDGGCADEQGNDTLGAAIFGTNVGDFTLRNCIITNNLTRYTGTVRLSFTSASTRDVIFENCMFNRNLAGGGAPYTLVTSGGTTNFTINNTVIKTNRAQSGSDVPDYTGGAGAILASAGTVNATIANSTITNNRQTGSNTNNADKGLFWIGETGTGTINFEVKNSIIYNNSITQTIGLSTASCPTSIAFTNTIREDMSTIPCSASSTSEINLDPQFVSTSDLSLKSISPAINAGDNTLVVTGTTEDIAGNSRIQDNTVDLGAYEASTICLSARNLTTVLKGYNNIRITWEVHPSHNNWDVAYVESGQPFSNATIIPNLGFLPYYNFTGLTEDTAYDFYVRLYCAATNEYTEWSQPYTDTTWRRPIYVNQTATGLNDGTTWQNAYTNLQTALTNAGGANREVWVAQGTYLPVSNQPDPRKATFEVTKPTQVYGGFAGTEQLRIQRDVNANETILSGDLSQNDNQTVTTAEATRQDNAYHILTFGLGNFTNNVIVDGFTISGANANGIIVNASGVPVPVQFDDATAGAIYYEQGITSVVDTKIVNCKIKDNSAIDNAVFDHFYPTGGVPFSEYYVSFESCEISNNYSENGAALNFSGGAANGYSRTFVGSVINSTMYDNVSVNGAACIDYNSSIATATFLRGSIINTTIAENTGVNGNAIALEGANFAAIRNSIIWSNTATPINTVSGSIQSDANIVSGGQINGISSDPLFANPMARDFNISTSSPAYDGGDSSYVPTSLEFDLAGNTRIINTSVDIGAFESQQTLSNIDFKIKTNDVVIYPNPTTSQLHIKSDTTISKIEVYNMLGKKVLETNTTSVNVSTLSSGLYIAAIKSENGTINKRFVKQ